MNYDNMTDKELLKLFVKKFEDYDGLKDRELEILGEHPNREFWDDNLDWEYDELIDEICEVESELNELKKYIKENR